MQTQMETKAFYEAARADVRRVLDEYPEAAPVVRLAIEEGRIQGDRAYLSRSRCGCFGAHIKKIANVGYLCDLFRRSSRSVDFLPIENFIMDIVAGDTIYTNERLADFYSMVCEWQSDQEAANANI